MVFVMARAKRSSTEKPVANLRIRKNQRKFPFRRTDAGNAQLFAALFKDNLRFDHKHKRWLVWGEYWWTQDADGGVMRIAKQAVIHRLRMAVNIGDDRTRREEVAWAMKSQSRYGLESMIALAQSEIPLADDGEQWDMNAWSLGVENGVVDLRTGKLREGRPQDRITLHCPVAFDPKAECPRWLRFLEEVFVEEDLIDYMRRVSGYCLSGSGREQCIFMFFGDGGNGKGTFVETLRYVLGPYACNLPFSAFEAKARSSIPNEVAATKGKRLVTASETGQTTELNEARLKMMSGEDKLAGRHLHGQLFEFYGTGKVVLSFNSRPVVKDDTYGFWRRVRLIVFPRMFDDDTRDQDLREKLQAEAPGILRWAVEGCLGWQENGLGIPATVREATRLYQMESNPLEAFLSECCEVNPGFSVPASVLWSKYVKWSEDNPEYVQIKAKELAARLLNRGFKKDRVGKARNRVWTGVRLRPGEADK